MQWLIKNGLIVTGQKTFHADVLTQGDRIARIAPNIEQSDASLIDASGCLVFAGFIDTHTHFDLYNGFTKTSDDFSTGTYAAIMGGNTCVLDFATQNKGETLSQALDNWHKKADHVSSCNYGFHMAITDPVENLEEQMEQMFRSGVSSYKLYMAYDNLRVNDSEIYRIMRKAKQLHSVVTMHCENGDLANTLTQNQKTQGRLSVKAHPLARPAEIEAEAINRFLYIARLADAPAYVVHLSTKMGLEEILRAKRRGQTVWTETCPQYLLLDESKYFLEGFESAKYMLAPPLRTQADIQALWEAAANGQIDAIGTDHCSFCFHGQKDIGREDFSMIPNGLPGVKNRAELIYTYGVASGKISLEQMAKLLSENPAQIFGMDHMYGFLQEGKSADIAILDPRIHETITVKNSCHHVDYTPYAGLQTKAAVRDVILNGNIAVKNQTCVAANQGRYIHREGNRYV